jgi:hypothetical protein
MARAVVEGAPGSGAVGGVVAILELTTASSALWLTQAIPEDGVGGASGFFSGTKE